MLRFSQFASKYADSKNSSLFLLQVVPTGSPEEALKKLCFSAEDCRDIDPGDGFEMALSDFREQTGEEEDKGDFEDSFFHIGHIHTLVISILVSK